MKYMNTPNFTNTMTLDILSEALMGVYKIAISQETSQRSRPVHTMGIEEAKILMDYVSKLFFH